MSLWGNRGWAAYDQAMRGWMPKEMGDMGTERESEKDGIFHGR